MEHLVDQLPGRLRLLPAKFSLPLTSVLHRLPDSQAGRSKTAEHGNDPRADLPPIRIHVDSLTCTLGAYRIALRLKASVVASGGRRLEDRVLYQAAALA